MNSGEALRQMRAVAAADGDLREAILRLLRFVGYRRAPLEEALAESLRRLELDPQDRVERRAAELLRQALRSGVFFD